MLGEKYYCDECDFYTFLSRGIQCHKGKKHCKKGDKLKKSGRRK